jgi:hypothetical protein
MTQPRRHPGVQEVEEERVLLVTKHRITGAERCDWWPSEQEAKDSNLDILEVRKRIHVPKVKKDWKGLASLLHMVLGKSGTQDYYTRQRPLDQREFFETVDDRRLNRKQIDKQYHEYKNDK